MGVTYPLGQIGDRCGRPWFVAAPASATKPKLLAHLHEAIRARPLSPRTEEAYRHWIKRYLFFHHLRHPQEMGEGEIHAFLTHLAVRQGLLGHSDVKTTTIYTPVLNRSPAGVRSPVDGLGDTQGGCL